MAAVRSAMPLKTVDSVGFSGNFLLPVNKISGQLLHAVIFSVNSIKTVVYYSIQKHNSYECLEA